MHLGLAPLRQSNLQNLLRLGSVLTTCVGHNARIYINFKCPDKRVINDRVYSH